MMRRIVLCASISLLACPPAPKPDAGTTGPAPIITSVSPSNGPVTGGTLVTVNGSNFADGAKVKFGDVFGDQVTVSSRARLTVRSPGVLFPGRVAVSVTNTDGQSGSLADAFTFDAVEQRVIEEAVLLNPADATDTSGAATVTAAVTGQVQVPNVTRGAGQGAGVRAQVGFAETVSTPPVAADFTWSDAAYLGDADGPTAGDLARDTYRADVSLPGVTSGTKVYLLAARFSVDNGTSWKLADRDGTANGVTASQLSRLTLSRSSVDWCKLGGEAFEAPPTVSLRTGVSGPLVYGQVYKTGVTDASGAGSGIRGQLGYGASGTDPATWTWADATFNHDTGSGANDEYQAPLPNPGAGTYKYAFRFSAQSGAWAYCDADGLATGGFTEAQAGTLTVSGLGVDRCLLQHPPTMVSRQGQDAGTVYGRVFAQGLTDGTAPATGLEGALGYGPPTDAPTLSTWQWTPAAYNLKVAGGGEEYLAGLVGPSPGAYVYGYRFRFDAGAWTYCDLDSSTNGFSAADAGQLTALGLAVDSCVLQFPTSLDTRQGRDAGLVFGRVFAQGVTDGTGPSTGIEGALGYGPPADAPSVGSWQWTPAVYNLEVAGGGEEYMATLLGPAPGSWVYGYRFRLLGGAWAYCDLDGSGNGFAAANAGQLTARPFDVDSCVLDTASSAPTVTPSAATPTVYARVSAATLTEAAGQGAGLSAEVGYGPPSTAPSAWTTWSAATYDSDQGVADQYRAVVTAPSSTGTYELAYRVRLGTNAWVYCDRDGSGNGYQPGQAGSLTVAPYTIQSCKLQAVVNAGFTPTGAVNSGDLLRAYVRVLVPGMSADAGVTPGLRAQVGVGTQGGNASASPEWGWREALFDGDLGSGEDEFVAVFQPAYTGSRAVAARVSLNGGAAWMYCDTTGGAPYNPSAQWALTVSQHAEFDWCNVQWPFTADAGQVIYGRVFKAGLTPSQDAGIIAELGVGKEVEDPGLAWRWQRGAFNVTQGDNSNEYQAVLTADAGELGLSYAWRYTLDGGTFCFGDINASNNAGFSGRDGVNPNLGVIVP